MIQLDRPGGQCAEITSYQENEKVAICLEVGFQSTSNWKQKFCLETPGSWIYPCPR